MRSPLDGPLSGFRSPVSRPGGVSSVYMTAFPMGSVPVAEPESTNYGPQASGVLVLNPATGQHIASSYFDLADDEGENDHYSFVRDIMGVNGYFAIGQSNLGSNADGTSVNITTIDTNLSSVIDRWDAETDSTTSLGDGQPGLVSYSDRLWAAFAVNRAIDDTGSAGGADDVFNGGTHGRMAVCHFEVDSAGAITLLNNTYVQVATGTVNVATETHCLARLPMGDIVMCGESVATGADLTATADAFDSSNVGRKGIIARWNNDLTTLKYLSFYGDTISTDELSLDGCDADAEGNYCSAIVDTDDCIPATDGTSNASPGDRAGGVMIFNAYNEHIFAGYVNQPVSGNNSETRRAKFDHTTGDVVWGGWVGTASTQTQGVIGRVVKSTANTFSRALSQDSTFTSPLVSAISGLTNKMTMEVKFTPNLENTLTLLDHGSNAAKIRLNAAGGTPSLGINLNFSGTPFIASSAGILTAGQEITLRACFDGSRGEARVYVDGASVVEKSGVATSWAFTAGSALLLMQGLNSSLAGVEYIKFWYDVETDWSTPTDFPDYQINQANCNVTPWKAGATAWTADAAYVTGSTATLTTSGTTGRCQIRDIELDDAGNVYVSGGGNNMTNTIDYDYLGTGGEPGADTVLEAFVAKFNSSLALQWLTRAGGESYARFYALELDSRSSPTRVSAAGRTGNDFPMGRNLP